MIFTIIKGNIPMEPEAHQHAKRKVRNFFIVLFLLFIGIVTGLIWVYLEGSSRVYSDIPIIPVEVKQSLPGRLTFLQDGLNCEECQAGTYYTFADGISHQATDDELVMAEEKLDAIYSKMPNNGHPASGDKNPNYGHLSPDKKLKIYTEQYVGTFDDGVSDEHYWYLLYDFENDETYRLFEKPDWRFDFVWLDKYRQPV